MKQVDQLEIVRKAMRFEEVRPVPYWLFGLTNSKEGPAIRLDTYYGGSSWRESIIEAIDGDFLGFIRERLGNGLAVDTFGVLLEEQNIAHVVEYPLKRPSLRGFIWPEVSTIVDWDVERKKVEQQAGKLRLRGFAMGLFERSWFLRGFQNVMIDMIENPSFYEELLDGILYIHLKVMDLIVARLPIEGFYGGDDVSDQRTVMMGMARWRRFFKPRLAKMIAHCHELGKPYILHACGNVLPLVDDLIEIGLDGLESLQPEATDLSEVKKKAREKLLLIGGMGVQSTMFRGTPDEVRLRTRWLLKEIGTGGGYVLGPAKPFDPEPTENIVAFLDELQHQNHG